ncbi:endonuclease/exonuclease/phosphatase family protein [Humitalea sp. 24SJ18S-53]|uniref:endonuclease/exonuclease/phosphatase family protein n=1 Tax=Humitalea sp. 24SJ18S-53 TaxID=3422307 RepID=UPI003D67477E
MRIAAFNVENLFQRARALNQDDWLDKPGRDPSRWSAGRKALDAHARLNALLRKTVYTKADKAVIVKHLVELGLQKSDESSLVILRKNRGTLLKRTKTGIEIVANGRDEWIGWLELKMEAVNEIATQNTARVLRDVDADVVVVVEAEDRISLTRFNEQVLEVVGGRRYDHIMLLDGNDDRGIDVGLISRAPFAVDMLRTHIDDRSGKNRIFSRDCPEFHLRLPSGEGLVVLANHFKSKGFGTPAESNAKRRAQARRVREIYDGLRAQGIAHIAILGDLNDTPDSDPLSPLLRDSSDLKDISEHPLFESDGRPGTYANGTKSNKIDFLLLSPALFAKVTRGGVSRQGVWGGTHGTLWPILPEMKFAYQAASDHAAIWADLDI